MKKTTFIAALVASTFCVGANAATDTATVNITGTIIPSACTISTGANGGTIDFGRIKASSLYDGKNIKNQDGTLTVNCDNETTAVVKVGTNGEKVTNDTAIGAYKTDKEFATYAIRVNKLNASGGTASNGIVVTNDAAVDNIDLNNLGATQFKKLPSNAAYFPMSGSYFAAGDANNPNNVGTFTTLTANYTVSAFIYGTQARAALKDGEQTFSGVVTFELEYI